MEQNSNENTQTQADTGEVTPPPAQTPKRTSRRASTKTITGGETPVVQTSEQEVQTPTPQAEAAPEEAASAPKRATRSRKKPVAADEDAQKVDEAKAEEKPTQAAEKPARGRVAQAKKTPAKATKDSPAVTEPADKSDTVIADSSAEEKPATTAKKAPQRRTRKTSAAKEETDSREQPSAEGSEPAIVAPAEAAEDTTAPKRGRRAPARKPAAKAQASDTTDETPSEESGKQDQQKDADKTPAKTDQSSRSQRSSRSSRSPRGDRSEQSRQSTASDKQEASEKTDSADKSEQSDDSSNRHDQQSRSSRTRQRDRKRRSPNHDDLLDPELTEEDVLLPIAGIIDVLDNYAFVRTSGYLPGPSDVYVSLGQVKKYNLRKGDAIVGAIRQPREGEGGGRQKYNAIVKIDTVNGAPLEEDMKRVDFNDLTPLYPQERLRLETTPEKITQRVIDLISPIGKGQRGLIVAPPKAGKTIVLQQIANAVAQNNPEAYLMVVLVDERPEEVTDMQRTVKGEVIASTFDRPAEDHTIVAELAIERAKRLVELGHDVVLLLDSITRLGRAYNLASPASGRVLTGGVDASALYPPKRFFGAARNIENGGSLTILATALVETGSKADEVIFEEFKGTGNMELRLSRQLADKRIFPAVNLNASSTRREEMLLSPDEVKITWQLRRALGNLSEEQAAELVLTKLKETSSNVEFLMQMQKSQGLS